MHSKRGNKEIKFNDKTDEVTEKSMSDTDFLFYCIHLL